jgi:hypothetical protein
MNKLITRLKISLLERLSAKKKEVGMKRPPGVNQGAFPNPSRRVEG